MKKLLFIFLFIVGSCAANQIPNKKGFMHKISVPIVDAAGIYSSVKVLQDDNTNGNAAAITNLSLLALNGGIGITYFISKNKNPTLRTIHRIAGYALTTASIWLSVNAATSDNLKTHDKCIAGGYTALTAVPLIMFRF